jgi:hypothetical protein
LGKATAVADAEHVDSTVVVTAKVVVAVPAFAPAAARDAAASVAAILFFIVMFHQCEIDGAPATPAGRAPTSPTSQYEIVTVIVSL